MRAVTINCKLILPGLRGEAIVCSPVRAVRKIANKNIVYLYSVDMEHGLGSIAIFRYSRQIGFTL